MRDSAEEARLRAVARYVVLDTPREQEFDDITGLAAAVTGCRLAAITFLDARRVWVKSAHGFEATELSRDISFCAPAFGVGSLAITDTAEDARCAEVAWVHEAPFVSCYAAEPLVTSDGFTLGHLVVMDSAPRRLNAQANGCLAALARQVIALLELRRTLVCYHTVIDAAGLVVFHADPDGSLVSVTPTWAKLTGHGVVRSLGKPLHALMHRDDGNRVQTCLADVVRDHSATRLDCRVATASGTDLPAELFAQALPTDRGLPPGIVGIIADISERRAREAEDQHRQKLESLGRVAAGVAHEINTPIQFIGDNTRYLAGAYEDMLRTLAHYQEVLGTDLSAPEKVASLTRLAEELDLGDLEEEVPSAVEQTLNGIDRVATIVHAMKAMSHPGHDQQAPADINEAIEAAVAVARNEIKYDADIVLDLGSLPPVRCFIADLSQVFLNLLVNAGDAVRESGRHGKITVASERDDDKHVWVTITDTGTGMPDDVKTKIFEPFFTTKPVGRGTGQGLALAHAVVCDKHQGVIDVDSTVGAGTSFTIRLPIAGLPEGTS